MKQFYLLLALLLLVSARAQQTVNVLFIGNSYTYVNDLPTLTKNVALSAGDTLIYDSNTPGGSTFQMHTTNATTISKITQGGWDYVVLQEQSQLPSFPPNQVQSDVFPYATRLDSLINAANTCAETMFYMTWGRKNGDASNCASWPPVCTYGGMDSMLRLNYMQMAADNHAVVSPVGAVWHWLRTNYPAMELYNADESHPSAAGSYAAACSFYTAIFRKDPTLITYNFTLPDTDALKIRIAAKAVVFDSLLTWHIGEYDSKAAFTISQSANNTVQLTNTSLNATGYYWQFGDGDTSTQQNPVHQFAVPGTYTITLIASDCRGSDTLQQQVILTPSALPNLNDGATSFKLIPNPVSEMVQIQLTSSATAETQVQITNIEGRIILTEKILGATQLVHLNGLPAGYYTATLLVNGKRIKSQQLIKQ